MLSRKEIKKRAREQLDGHIFSSRWVLAVACVIVVALLDFVGGLIIIGALLIAGTLNYGLIHYFSKTEKNKDGAFVDIFQGFKDDFVGTFALSIIETIFTFLWSLLLIIPGIIKGYSYSMSMYLKHEKPTRDWYDCHKTSMKMMKGKKWKLFVLDLSFLGWYILGFLCLGVGVFFVMPYHLSARYNFFLEAKKDI